MATPPFRRSARHAATLGATAVALCFACSGATAAQERPSAGAVLFGAAGCATCHTDTPHKGPLLGGGRALKTPFGVFYTPNISSDRTHGIGGWSEADFIRALREGISPSGAHYFPVFPYTSFTNMTDADLKAIRTYILSLPPSDRANRPHDVGFPFDLRFLQVFWRLLFFTEGPYRPDASKSATWNRGAYLVTAVAHCVECHTPRNFLGGLETSRRFAGASKRNGPEGVATPNITPGGEVSKWSKAQIAEYLATGEDPDGDYAGSLMADVIEKGTSLLSDADRLAIAEYVKSLKPIR